MTQVKNGRLPLIPARADISGHDATGPAKFWQQLRTFLDMAPRQGCKATGAPSA